MKYIAQVLTFALMLVIASFVIPAVAQQPVVQFQAVITTINNIQAQLATLSARVNSVTIPAGPNTVLAGPTSGSLSNSASFRKLIGADLPNLAGDTSGSYSGNTVNGLHFGATAIPLSSTAPTTNQFLEFNGSQLVGAVPVGSVPTPPVGSGQLFFNNAGTPAWMANAGALGQLLIGQGAGSPLWFTATGDMSINSLGQTVVATIQGQTPSGNCTGITPFLASINGTVQGTCASTTVTPQVGAVALNPYMVGTLPTCTPVTSPKFETWVSDASAACTTGSAPSGGGSNLCKVICNGPSGSGWLEELVSGTGTVTSVGMTGDGIIFSPTVTGSPVTGAGTLAPVLLTQTAHAVLIGPSSGAAATPTFRVLAGSDIPNPGGDVTNTYPAMQVNALHFGATQIPISGTPPTTGQCLQYSGTNIGGAACGGGGGGGTNDTVIANLSGTTAGTVTCYEPWRAVSSKEVSCLFVGYQNTTNVAQTVTYPVGFTNANSFVFEPNSNPPSSSGAGALSLPVNMAAPFSGPMFIRGL